MAWINGIESDLIDFKDRATVSVIDSI